MPGDSGIAKEESMSEEKPAPASGKELDYVLRAARMETRHPKATLAEIEREPMKRLAQVQAQIIEELSQSLSPEERRLTKKSHSVRRPDENAAPRSVGSAAAR